MREPYTLSGPVLGSCAAEQVEDALMILWIDAAAVVGNFVDRKAKLGAAPHRNDAGDAGFQIFERIVDQIREDLLQRQTVAGDVRQRFDPDLGLGFSGLV